MYPSNSRLVRVLFHVSLFARREIKFKIILIKKLGLKPRPSGRLWVYIIATKTISQQCAL